MQTQIYTHIDATFIRRHLNCDIDKLRSIYRKAREITSQRTGETNEELNRAAADDEWLARATASIAGDAFNTKAVRMTVLMLDYMTNTFSTTHHQISPTTEIWGGFLSHDTFTTTDNEGLTSAIMYCIS